MELNVSSLSSGRRGERKKKDETNCADNSPESPKSDQTPISYRTSSAEPMNDHDARIQSIFTENPENIPSFQKDVEKVQIVLKNHYEVIKKEYDDRTENYYEGFMKPWLVARKKRNFFRPHPESNTKEIGKIKIIGLLTNDSKCKNAGFLYLKPDTDETGSILDKPKIKYLKVEVGDVFPRMSYWVSMEQSTLSKDQLRLSHVPYFERGTDENELSRVLNEKFPDGIHGCSDNHGYINDWLLYKLFLKALPDLPDSTAEPDIFYYAVYRLWPNKLSQRQLSFSFPDWCDLYAEKDFEWHSLESWKNKYPLEIAVNVQNPKCYACLSSYSCPEHGFIPEIPVRVPNGNFVCIRLKIPSDKNRKGTHCSEKCWKTIKRKELDELFLFEAEHIAEEEFDVYLDKLKILKLTRNEGAMLISAFILNIGPDFCDSAKQSINPNWEENPRMNSCAGIYRLIIQLSEAVSENRYNQGIPAPLKPKKNRIKKFRKNQAELMKTKNQATTNKNEDEMTLTDVTPFVGCRHNGPCATTDEYCACRQNGTCSFLCECDTNCPQRFSGCNCSTGQCQSKACQCYRANWECNPITCQNCKCDILDEDGAICKNFAMTRLAQKKLIVAPSRIAGNGLFILESAEKDEFITEYVGEKISDDEVERRGAIYDRLNCSYIFNLPSGGAIDSYKLGNIARFANHDENNPTVYARTLVVAGEHRIGFYAKNTLEPGDELLFDYSYSTEHRNAIGYQEDSKKPRGKQAKKMPASDEPSTSGTQ